MAVISSAESESGSPVAGRWASALAGDVAALRGLGESYWYCTYAWLRRNGRDPADATAATLACWARWLSTEPPLIRDAGAARLREWLPLRLASMEAHDGPPAFAIDAAWAKQRFAQEPEGEPDAIFQRRWALTILEFTVTAQRDEYADSGKAALFDELLPFSGFENVGESRYTETATRVGMSAGAVRKAVFDFRTRQRELLHAFVGDTVADPADIESEITALLCAADAPGPAPTALHELRPEEMFARAMRTAKISGAGGHAWTPPTPEEMAHLFPHYEILSMIGRGGMGAVYQARQIELDRLVALKLLPLEISVNKDFADRFRREARAMAKLNHPNIITVHDFGQTAEGHLFFAMEFVEGANLHDIIHGPGLDAEHALSIAGQVCIALAYAHGKGVVHRDMKPANVMIDTASQVKVADFGLARLIDPAADAVGQTVTGTVMGTPDYMAPEQKRGMSVDHRADIYSLGVMIYEMLCRETPQGAFDPPSQRTGCDARIDKIVLKAMQQAPERRYQSTTEMKVDVDSVRTPLPAAPPATVRPAAPKFSPNILASPTLIPTPTREGAKKSRPPLWIVLFMLIAGGILFWSFAADHASQRRATEQRNLVEDQQRLHARHRALRAGQQREHASAGKSSALGTATKEAPFVNTLGMKFVPVSISGGRSVLFCVWQTRVQDFRAFATDRIGNGNWDYKNGLEPMIFQRNWWSTGGWEYGWQNCGFERTDMHPVVCVSRMDAKAFCAWLTTKEQLPDGWSYRLPTDAEWSEAVGLHEAIGGTPKDKDGQFPGVHPWGTQWPPPNGAGNYGGEEVRTADMPLNSRVIEGYRDIFPRTSPVGSFSASQYGLYDMGGNVREHCEDLFDGKSNNRVCRGASWRETSSKQLLSSHRESVEPNHRVSAFGFRCVLAPASSVPPAEN